MSPAALSPPAHGTAQPIRVLARREREQPFDGSTTSPQRVRDWMTRLVRTVDLDDPLSQALDVMTAEGVRHVVVSRDGALRGALSTEDLLQAARNSHPQRLDLDLERRLVKELMTTSPLTAVEADSLLAVAASRMGEDQVRFLPVLDGRRVVGVLTTDDLLAALSSHCRPSQGTRG